MNVNVKPNYIQWLCFTFIRCFYIDNSRNMWVKFQFTICYKTNLSISRETLVKRNKQLDQYFNDAYQYFSFKCVNVLFYQLQIYLIYCKMWNKWKHIKHFPQHNILFDLKWLSNMLILNNNRFALTFWIRKHIIYMIVVIFSEAHCLHS